MPTPTIVTTDDPVRAELSESAPPRRDSSRMPAIFRPATRTSFGHLSRASTRATRSARAKATDWVESTVPRRTMTPGALLPGIVEPAEARDELGAHGFLLGEALPLLRDDLRGRALGKIRLRQLRAGELDPLVDLGDLLLDPLALRRRVHDARQLDVEL